MSYGQKLKNGKPRLVPQVLVAGVTPEIDLEGGTLVGLMLLADITSTTFTITVSNESGGTFVTVKDPLAAGANITWTVAGTATGYYHISKEVTFGFRYCKLVFDQSETPTVYISKRNLD